MLSDVQHLPVTSDSNATWRKRIGLVIAALTVLSDLFLFWQFGGSRLVEAALDIPSGLGPGQWSAYLHDGV